MDSPRRSRNRAACRRCQRRKIRCNGDLPQCFACKKANVSCVNDGKQEVNRSYISKLQKRVQWLETLVREQTNVRLEDGPPLDLAEATQNDMLQDDHADSAIGEIWPQDGQVMTSAYLQLDQPTRTFGDAQQPRSQTRQAHEIGLVSLSSGAEPRYIGPSSGYFLANLIFSNAGRRAGLPGSQSNKNEPISLSRELFNSPTTLPNRKEDTLELSSKYFAFVHLVYPFLHEQSHMQRVEKVYTICEDEINPVDAFHIYMVLAIASSDLSRRFRVRLPAEGYYTAATKYFEGACVEGTLEGLQSQLLLMVYALHNPSCGVNIWGLNYQCLGTLIDLGLQRDVRSSSAFPISFMEQELRTRIFWVVYNFDRTLGTMMGRPIGVRDEACDLRLPSDVADKDLTTTPPTDTTSISNVSHMTYSIHLFKLARINSEIKYIMHSVCRDPPRYAYPAVTDIHQWQRDMIDQLQSWVSKIPRAAGMESIAKICETKYHEMMILVLRPSPGIPEPSDDVLSNCFQHATELLRGFGDLYRQESLMYSRLIVHSIFLGTLIMLHCLWRLPQVAERVQIDDVVADTSISLNILSSIGEYWTEAKRARDCIHELSGATVQRLVKGRGLGSSPRPRRAFASIANVRDAGHTSIHGMADSLGTVDSAIGVAPPLGSFDEYNIGLESSSWLKDSIPGGFMDFTGVPDFDSLMWEVFNNN